MCLYFIHLQRMNILHMNIDHCPRIIVELKRCFVPGHQRGSPWITCYTIIRSFNSIVEFEGFEQDGCLAGRRKEQQHFFVELFIYSY